MVLNAISLMLAKYGWNMHTKTKSEIIYSHIVQCDGISMNG